jgi:hypothetical protein
VVATRRGTSRLGCLVGGLVVVTAVYFGFNIGEVYLRYYRFRDAMVQEARFAQARNDLAIRTHIKLVVDSLGLPDEAGVITIRRNASSITISSEYTEHVELPMFVREFKFAPKVVRTF